MEMSPPWGGMTLARGVGSWGFLTTATCILDEARGEGTRIDDGAKAARSDECKKSGPPRKADPTGYSPTNSVSARNGGQRRRNCSRRRREGRRGGGGGAPCSLR